MPGEGVVSKRRKKKTKSALRIDKSSRFCDSLFWAPPCLSRLPKYARQVGTCRLVDLGRCKQGYASHLLQSRHNTHHQSVSIQRRSLGHACIPPTPFPGDRSVAYRRRRGCPLPRILSAPIGIARGRRIYVGTRPIHQMEFFGIKRGLELQTQEYWKDPISWPAPGRRFLGRESRPECFCQCVDLHPSGRKKELPTPHYECTPKGSECILLVKNTSLYCMG